MMLYMMVCDDVVWEIYKYIYIYINININIYISLYIALYVVAQRRGSMMILQGEVIVKEIAK